MAKVSGNYTMFYSDVFNAGKFITEVLTNDIVIRVTQVESYSDILICEDKCKTS